MNTVYVGLDLGSSAIQQVVIRGDGSIRINRFSTSEANLIKAFSDQRGELQNASAVSVSALEETPALREFHLALR